MTHPNHKITKIALRPEGSEDTEIEQIPANWSVMRLGDTIEELKNGFASGKREEAGIVQIRMNNVTTDGGLLFDSYLKVPAPENIDPWLLKKDDFLFNNTNSIDLVGKSTIFNDAPFPCTFSNHFTRIRFKKELVLPKLILYHFITLWKTGYFKSVAIRHVGQSAVHTNYLLKLKIPLPPLPEQKKIVEVLGTVDSAIQKVSEAIEKTGRLKRGLMQKLLTKGIGHKKFKDSEVGMIPEGWETVKLEGIGTLQYGFTASAKHEDTGIKFLRITDITDNGIDWLSVPYCELNESELKKYELHEGDVLFARIGSTTGKTCYITRYLKGVFASYLIRFQSLAKNTDTKFLYFYTQSQFYWSQINKNKDAHLKKGINAKVLGSVLIPLPPLPEQKKIAEVLGTVDRKLELELARKGKLERVKLGLMDDLLTGRKRAKL